MKDVVFDLSLDELKEMDQLCGKNPFDTSEMTWTQTQQVLVLWSLEELFKSYGLEVNYSIDLIVKKKPTNE